MLSEMSDGERQMVYDFTCMWNLKSKIDEQTWPKRNRLTDTEDKLVVARAGGYERRDKMVEGG